MRLLPLLRLATMTSVSCGLLATPAHTIAQKPVDNPTLVYIGSTGKTPGIYLFRLLPVGEEVSQNVTLIPLGVVADTPNASFLELDLKNRRLFAVSEVDDGVVSAFAIDRAGKLMRVNQRPSKGGRPCQLALDKPGRNVLVANCATGSVSVLPIAGDGQLGEATDVVSVAKSATCVTLDPESRFAFVCDQGSDKIAIYRFEPATGKLTPNQPASIPVKAGAGPRQILFRADGRFAYVVNAKNSTITTFAYDAATGALTEAQTVSTVPEYFDGPNTAGELGLHRSGKWLYVSNIGHNSVVLFNIDQDKGTLTFVEEQGTGGRNPRFFGIEPASKHLAISNSDSDTVLASRIDEGNGRLKPSGIFVNLSAPASVRFLPPVGESAEK